MSIIILQSPTRRHKEARCSFVSRTSVLQRQESIDSCVRQPQPRLLPQPAAGLLLGPLLQGLKANQPTPYLDSHQSFSRASLAYAYRQNIHSVLLPFQVKCLFYISYLGSLGAENPEQGGSLTTTRHLGSQHGCTNDLSRLDQVSAAMRFA